MILELYGNPGCGKSYAIKYVLNNKITCEEKKNSIIKDTLIGIVKKIIVATPEALAIKRRIYKVIRGENTRCIYIERPLSEWVENIVMLNSIYKYKKNLLMDEGLIQRTVAMCVNFGWSYETLDKIISELTELKKVRCINLYLPVEECVRSIEQRNRHKADMDYLDKEILVDFLNQYDSMFSLITLNRGFLSVGRNELDIIKEIWND